MQGVVRPGFTNPDLRYRGDPQDPALASQFLRGALDAHRAHEDREHAQAFQWGIAGALALALFL